MVSTQKVSSIETNHKGMIHDVQYDYYGKRLATCSTDGTVQIFDVSKGDSGKGETANKLWSHKAHNGPIWQISWAHPKFGNVFATCSFDKKVAVWKEVKSNDWQEVISFEHTASVNSISWAPWECGLRLAAASADGFVSLLSRKSDDTWEKPIKFQAHELGVNAVSWASLPTLDDLFGEPNNDKYNPLPRLATGSSDKTVKIWEQDSSNPSEFKVVCTLSDHSDWVRDVAFCPSIGAPYDILVSCSEDQTVNFYSNSGPGANDFKRIETKKHEGPVWRLSWNATGNMIAVTSASGESESTVDVYRENEQGIWERISKIQDDSSAAN